MRDILLIAAAVVVGALGCATEAEKRQAKIDDETQFWGSMQLKPDVALGIQADPTAAPEKPKKPAPTDTPAPTVVQASDQTPQ
jgi:hypothetical protein